jgi:hypothetical protein
MAGASKEKPLRGGAFVPFESVSCRSERGLAASAGGGQILLGNGCCLAAPGERAAVIGALEFDHFTCQRRGNGASGALECDVDLAGHGGGASYDAGL